MSRRNQLGLNQSQMANKIGVNSSIYGDLENMKMSPLGKRGNWLKVVLDISDYFKCMPEDLFPEAIQAVEAKNMKLEFSAAEMMALSGADDTRELMCPHSALARKELHAGLNNILSKMTGREEKIIRMYHGISCDAHTVDEIAAYLNITTGRVREIYKKAISKAQHPIILNKLKAIDPRDHV